MKKILFFPILVLIGLSSTTFSFADSHDWSGTYIGLNVGDAISDSSLETRAVDTTGAGTYLLPLDIAQIAQNGSQDASSDTFLVGGQIGHNCQIDHMVYGVETDLQWFNFKESESVTVEYLTAPGTFFTDYHSVQAEWLFTARPRIGYATGNFLFYGTGGLALSRITYKGQFSDTFTPAFESSSVTKTKAGWTVGGGAEYALGKQWTLRLEYLFVDLGSVEAENSPLIVPAASGDVFNREADLNHHLIRVGINYKF